jgi:hypothetical protein
MWVASQTAVEEGLSARTAQELETIHRTMDNKQHCQGGDGKIDSRIKRRSSISFEAGKYDWSGRGR